MFLMGLPFIVAAGLLMQNKVEGKRPLKPGEVVTMFTFDQDKVGELPGTWRNRGAVQAKKPAEWTVVVDTAAPSPPHVLAVTKLAEDPSGYNVAMVKNIKTRVFTLTAKVKPMSGKEDQGGGLIWRAVDDQNYYVARINPLENNFRVYKVVDGKRTQMGTVDVETRVDTWYTMEVISLGDGFVCTIDQRWTLEFGDDSFPEAGLVGVWTKADAMTAFDDFEVIAKDQPPAPGK